LDYYPIKPTNFVTFQLRDLLTAELPDDLLEDSCEGSPAVSRDQQNASGNEASGK